MCRSNLRVMISNEKYRTTVADTRPIFTTGDKYDLSGKIAFGKCVRRRLQNIVSQNTNNILIVNVPYKFGIKSLIVRLQKRIFPPPFCAAFNALPTR